MAPGSGSAAGPCSESRGSSSATKSTPSISREAARKIIEDISIKHGYIRPEILARMPEADRREVQRAMLMKDQLIASSVTTLARNLYTSSARFVFELLQNADDNSYTKARARGAVPHVSFRIYHDQIVVDCNEDGFNADNVAAICAIGKSSKTGAQVYIGEKGIGFKSVFMAAHRVSIRSGPFSFSFQHRNGESGMGMITPLWDEDAEDLGDARTRITLVLHDDASPDERAKQRQTIHQQFRDIHEAVLLFMNKIGKIEIAFYDGEKGQMDSPSSTITHSIERRADDRVVVTRSTVGPGVTRSEGRHYHVTKHVATGLANNENRTQPQPESEVVLAFPLTAQSDPVVAQQWLFAFLPVRQMGFKFLIQADFVTQANRQDIVTTSARNEGLADGIADAFVKAVLQMCNHATLRYKWMRYLPSEEDDGYPWDDFWRSVIRKIKTRIQATPVLQPAAPGPLRHIARMRQHWAMALDRHGQPLFPDKDPEVYLSLEYNEGDLNRLREYGLHPISVAELIERAEADLASESSRFRNSKTDEDWHSRAARVLSYPFGRSGQQWTERQQAVRKLKLLPQRNPFGFWWTSAANGPVYYPEVDGTDLQIPENLGLMVVDPAAVANAERKKLFDLVGVTAASVVQIRDAILARHRRWNHLWYEIKPAHKAEHLRFLYSTEHLVASPGGSSYADLRVVDHRGAQHNADDELYFCDDEPYGAANLLKPTAPGDRPGDGAPGCNVLFLHDAYFREIPEPPAPGRASWKEWLRTKFSVRRCPRLTECSAKSERHASMVCKYVARHRPEKFVGYLRAAWQFETLSETSDRAAIAELGETKVLCAGEGVQMHPLRTTYLPVRGLQELCRRFMLEGEFFPWLKLESPRNYDTFPRDWECLGKVWGLGFRQDTLEFALRIHACIARASPEDVEKPERLCDLYSYLQAKVRESSDPELCKKKIRDAFKGCVYIPNNAGRQTWGPLVACVWDAPIDTVTRFALARRYAARFPGMLSGNRSDLASFFSHTLGIPNCGWKDLVEDIKRIRLCLDGFDRLPSLYKCLDKMHWTDEDATELKKVFETGELIYAFVDGKSAWLNTSRCLWSSATQIAGRATLQDQYGDLESFFLDRLGVPTLTANLLYEKLKAPSCPGLPVAEIKQTILEFNSFLAKDDGDEYDPAPVLENEIFPVRSPPSGRVCLQKGTTGFALLDRKRLGDDFAGLAKFLDFSMDEIRTLGPFVRWAGLEERYLSRAVKEITSADYESTRPISSPSRDVKQKAHALVRVAATYKSPRVRGGCEELYALLRRAKTLETDKITAELLLSQDGRQLRVEKDAATLHIREGASELTIYVPRDRRAQEICFTSKLPRCLYEWLMTDPTTRISDTLSPEAINVVQSVLSVKEFALSEVLDEHGISSIDIPDLHTEDAQQDDDIVDRASPAPGTDTPLPIPSRTQRSHSSSSSSNSSNISSNISSSIRSNSSSSIRSNSSSDVLDAWTPMSSTFSPDVVITPTRRRQETTSFLEVRSNHATHAMPRPTRTQDTPAEDTSGYAAFLRTAVDAARRAVFPSRGAFDLSGIRTALLEATSSNASPAADEPSRFSCANLTERRRKVGAAGELFVFEMLSRLTPRLPGFWRANWRSTIRYYAASHPDYSMLTPWDGNETSDIVYNDVGGAFTDLLVDKGYLAPEMWAGAKPKYYIEVKATTGPCSTPFFMSRHQYQLMQTTSNNNNNSNSNNADSGHTDSLYVIVRVFNLGTDAASFKVLVDPESMRQRGELAFTAETWSVVTEG
ncbi:hypothetical protein VTK73DRAFT_8654 [Phialemonium thermophilum]|uniref:Protein NO VEIN C-terminal domain-containing protein n=1 Tax=Phialemonium thermophilum TaxID=223376 RepID=A0ABR3XN10_9PEZI